MPRSSALSSPSSPTSSSSGVGRYRRLLDAPGAPAALLLGTLARLPIGMTGLALLLLVQEETGSFARGGLVSAVYAASLAAASPVRGSAVDRRGARSVLLLYGAVHPVALLAVLAVLVFGVPLPVLLALTALAGSTFPPVGPLVRALWGVLYDDEGERATAYALDAVLVEASFVGGPLMVGLAVAVGSPALAVAASAALVATGTLFLAGARASALLTPSTEAQRPPLRAPLLAAPVRRLLTAVLLLGGAFGATEVAVAAYAVEQRSPGLVGPLLAVWASGSVTGGLTYGAREWRAATHRQYPWLVAALAAGLALPLLAAGPVSLGVLLFTSGLCIAPFVACNSALLARAAPAGSTTTTFAWSGSAIVGGIALGTAGAGWLAEHTAGAIAAFGLATAVGVLALVTALTGRRLRAPARDAAA